MSTPPDTLAEQDNNNSYTPPGPSSLTSARVALHHKSSKESIQSHQTSLSNFSTHSAPSAVYEDHQNESQSWIEQQSPRNMRSNSTKVQESLSHRLSCDVLHRGHSDPLSSIGPYPATRLDPASSEQIGGVPDTGVSAVEISLTAMKEASALIEKIPWFSPVAGLILQALTMREEVKQYTEWDVVMERLESIAHLVNGVGVACKRYNLEEKDLPDGLCGIFQSLETELVGIKGTLDQNKETGGIKKMLLRNDLLRKVKQYDAKLSNEVQIFHAMLTMDVRFAQLAEGPMVTHGGAPIQPARSSDIVISMPQEPCAPQIFFGRDSELGEIIDMIFADIGSHPARIAILGPGGYGKTALANAVLTHHRVQEHFGNARYLVSCRSVFSSDALLIELAKTLHLDGTTDVSWSHICSMLNTKDCILCLDNFESPWDQDGDTRNSVEELLSRVTEVCHATVLITMRGTVRPGQTQWTMPLLPPLMTLDHDSAKSLWVHTTDNYDGFAEELIKSVDYVPLTVTLLAHLSQATSPETLLKQWHKKHAEFIHICRATKLSNLEYSELVCCNLIHLSPHDILSCRRTCRAFLYNDSPFRYLVQMERAAVTDDMRPGLSYPERLRILEQREKTWAMLDFRKSTQVCVPFESTGIYDFTGGAFLLGTRLYSASRRPTVGYSYIFLPSLSDSDSDDAQHQALEWKGLNLGIQILDVGLAVHEHDLIAAVTAKTDMDSRSGSESHMTLEMRLLSFSTGQPHPHAEKPIIFITTKSVLLGHCNVLIEIVGDFLALLITFPWAQNEHEDMFFIVRWKKGDTHCLRSSEWGAYAYFSFLSEDTLVIPNLIQNTLEIVKIAIESDDTPHLVPLCILNLPPLTRRASIVRLGCRAEPNPTGSRGPLAIPAPSSRPFRDKAEDAIILFNVVIEDGQFHFPDTRPFTFIVHRRALLGHIPAAYRECAPFCSIPEPAPAHVPWAEWGVTATRWFEGDPASMRWITTTAAQRAVTMEDVGAPTPIIVRDFNPYMVRSARGGVSANGRPRGYNWSAQLPNGNRMAVKVEESVLSAGSVFKEDVRSSLPYVEIVTRAEYRYEGVLIDEERILGLKTSQEDELGISSFDVHILG